MRYVVIMAGGSGTRLWPLSRKGTPKQLLKLIGGRSLLRLAFERARRLVPDDRILVVTGAPYLDEVAADLPEVSRENLLGEPEGRDSLNAVAWPAAVLARRDPHAVIAQLTADQLIEPLDAFVEALEEAFDVAENTPSSLVTLGVIPTSPHTGYGYLHRGPALHGFPTACQVLEFREKPDAATAAAYLASGDYWWNAGMFVWRAETVLEQLEALEPDTHAKVLELAGDAANGAKGHVGLSTDAPIPALQEFGKRYREKYGFASDHNGVKGYMAVFMVKWATEKQKKLDKKGLADTLRGATIKASEEPGILIDTVIEQNGDLDRESFLAEVVNGKQVINTTLPRIKP